MEQDLERALKGVCDVLNKNDVEYLLIGGTAVSFHGHNRPTMGIINESVKYDIDFWYNPTYKNYFNLMKGLRAMHLDTSRLENETDIKKAFLKIVHSYFKTDFLPSIPGHSSFNDVYNRRNLHNLKGVELSIIGLDDLIVSKKATGRDYDLTDIDALLKINKSKGNNNEHWMLP